MRSYVSKMRMKVMMTSMKNIKMVLPMLKRSRQLIVIMKVETRRLRMMKLDVILSLPGMLFQNINLSGIIIHRVTTIKEAIRKENTCDAMTCLTAVTYPAISDKPTVCRNMHKKPMRALKS